MINFNVKRLFVLNALLLVCGVVFTSCKKEVSEYPETLIGDWENDHLGTYTFNENGTCMHDAEAGEYVLTSDSLILIFPEFEDIGGTIIQTGFDIDRYHIEKMKKNKMELAYDVHSVFSFGNGTITRKLKRVK